MTAGPLKTLVRQKDIQYYSERAEQEIFRAQQAEHPEAVRSHYLLAGYYLDMVYNSPAAPARPRNSLQH